MSDSWTTDVRPPERCRCTRLVVETLDETLDCPLGWRVVELAGVQTWVHQ